MEKEELLKIFDREQRIDVLYPDIRREQPRPDLVRHISLTDQEGFVIFSKLDPTSFETVLEEQIDFFEGIGQDFEWKVYDHDTPSDLKEKLAARGFAVGEEEAVMVLDLEEAPSIFWAPMSHSIRRLTDFEELEAVNQIEHEVWNEDFTDLTDYLRKTIQKSPHLLSVFVAYAEEKPVSAAWMNYHPGSSFASLWGGSTLKEFRGQGFYTALLAVRAQEARQRGVRFLTVDASPMSRPILAKYGFQLISFAYACKWKTGKKQGRGE